MPRPPRGVAADSNTSGGAAARPIMSVAAAARSRFAPASWNIDSDEAEVGERVERRDDGVDDRLQRVLLRRAEWRGAGAGRCGNRGDDGAPGVFISACASFQPSAT